RQGCRALKRGQLLYHVYRAGLPCVNFSGPIFDFCLPLLGLSLYPEDAEEEVHRQADAPANEGVKEPEHIPAASITRHEAGGSW
ncbi:MAG TPA: hypothetical protein VFQ30_08690, partial [Ktedonobacteraceae bacterium]|nr:hypothetical protein [Ktedonobacteraceae bacterium]